MPLYLTKMGRIKKIKRRKKMDIDIGDVSFNDLLRTAVKSEIESQEVYNYLVQNTDNFVIKNRFKFLVSEEEKHEEFVRDLYKEKNPSEELEVPEKSPVPMPFVKYDENTDETEIIEQAMESEMASRDFYKKVAEKAKDVNFETNPRKLLNYLADMEENHYEILKGELERAKEFEEFDQYHPAMHQGP